MEKKFINTPKLPDLPGIYVFKDKENNVLYVGKAKSLKKRIQSYFQRQTEDWKIQELVREHAIVEHIITKSETEALLLEAQLIRSFKPKYNVLLKYNNPFIFILITNTDLPQIKLVSKKKEKGTYFGPFLYKQKVRNVYDYLMRTLKLNLCTGQILRKTVEGCLNYHIGRCAGNCLSDFSVNDYKSRILLAQKLLEGNYEDCKKSLSEQIAIHNQNFEFEISKRLTAYLQNLETIFNTLKTGFTYSKYYKDITAITIAAEHKSEQPIRALEDLQILLNLDTKPVSIDCFDISHFQSSSIVGSCIRFTHGLPEKDKFRRFKIKTLAEQNDYAALQEIVTRRYKDPSQLPDVILIDGGKGQLNAIKDLVPVPCISLAKREETLFTPNHPEGVKLNVQLPLGQLLIAIRDYAHHFAVSYHKIRRSKSTYQ